MKTIKLSELHPHPQNPRLSPRGDVVEQIALQIAESGEFDPAHALIVRPNASGYEIISGHHRHLGAEKAGLAEVPCWIREMPDDAAYMALVLNNAQGELHPLEEGKHAAESGLDLKAYAAKVGKVYQTLVKKVWAWRVYSSVIYIDNETIRDQWYQLATIHAAPQWLWSALATKLIEEDWTVEVTRKQVQKYKDIASPPVWADSEAIANHVIAGSMKLSDVASYGSQYEETRAALIRGDVEVDSFIGQLNSELEQEKPELPSEVMAICQQVKEAQNAMIREREQQVLSQRREEEARAARIAQLKTFVSLEEWKSLDSEHQQALLNLDPKDLRVPKFNKQENDAIEWAQWSWNPVTGCRHDCPYCYARDIANASKMAKVYPYGFEPTFRPSMLLAPRGMKVPDEAKTDARFRNVFTCSMADLFGRWVPPEWINAVLDEIRNAPEWNFLCLTKFPKRMAEFDIPENAWMGTTVDLQARVQAAESGFANVKAGVRWLSVEPMLEPLRFSHLERFDWVVIGGASRSTQTPEWHPPFEWIVDLVEQARAAGCKVYFKTNLLSRRLLELPFNAAIPSDNVIAPPEFSYLSKSKQSKGVA